MAQIDTTQDRRCRGRPQVRPDDETRRIIYEAARHEFAASGYAATSMEAVARRAGVSTKTLYRLVPNKASLFEGMGSDRLGPFLAHVYPPALECVAFADGSAGTNLCQVIPAGVSGQAQEQPMNFAYPVRFTRRQRTSPTAAAWTLLRE